MTDFAATAFSLAVLLQAAIMQLEAKRRAMGKQSGDDVELRQREQALDDALSVRQIEIETELQRTSTLIGRVATLEGKIRDLENELRVVLMEKGEMAELLSSSEKVAHARGVELAKKEGIIGRLEAEVRRTRSLIPKADK